ncbi:TPA: hypothetical protein EYN98_31100 [Candidatus Poribacteria bacterium]|nr:hypothetical protein [Candidatus Poribacteria bacterium]HIB85929.1 hypothetical protein [Candidatus Poribacteria bacterium]HIB99194.1 hypothetical protein [Candidatus Poribacteria bacterium]HIN30724.1 hypothetical protein [Candidatus Poribacteria bacterium]HIO09692.1 hypothetical protein [Candidatus Poribacteria bacterium]
MAGRIGLFSCIIHVALIMVFYLTSTYGEERSTPCNYVIKIDKKKIYFDLGYNHGVRKGMVYQVLRRGDNAERVQIAKIFVTETFDGVSKAVLNENSTDFVIEVGDWVEIILESAVGAIRPMEEIQKDENKEIKSKPSVIPAVHETKEETGSQFNWMKWTTLTTGVVTGLASASYYNSINSTNREIEQAEKNQEYVIKVRQLANKGKKAQTRYYIFTGISATLLSYASYKFLLDSRTNSTTFNISRKHMEFRFHRNF